MGNDAKNDVFGKLGEMLAREVESVVKKTDGATVNLLESIDNSLSDLVDVLEKNGGDSIAKAIIKAIEGMKPAQVSMPSPTIEVHPTKVEIPAPIVHVQPAGEAVFDIKFDYGPNGRLLGMKVTRGIK